MTDPYQVALENLKRLKTFKSTNSLITLDSVTGELLFDDNVPLDFDSITTKTLKKSHPDNIEEPKEKPCQVINLRLDFNKKWQQKFKQLRQQQNQQIPKIETLKTNEILTEITQTKLKSDDQKSITNDGVIEVQKARLEDKKMLEFVVMQSNNTCNDTGFFMRIRKTIKRIQKYWDRSNLIYPFSFRKLKARNAKSFFVKNDIDKNGNANTAVSSKNKVNANQEYFIITEDFSKKVVNPENAFKLGEKNLDDEDS